MRAVDHELVGVVPRQPADQPSRLVDDFDIELVTVERRLWGVQRRVRKLSPGGFSQDDGLDTGDLLG